MGGGTFGQILEDQLESHKETKVYCTLTPWRAQGETFVALVKAQADKMADGQFCRSCH